MSATLEDIKKLAHDVYFNPTFSKNDVSGQDALRNAVMEALGGEKTPYSWAKHKYDVFEIISVAIDAVMPQLLTNQFDNIADIRTVALGDKPLFESVLQSLMQRVVLSSLNLIC